MMPAACLLLLSATAAADSPHLGVAKEHSVRVEVVHSERWGWWEKSLIVTLSEPIRVLSTNEGFVEALAVVNHAAHPLLWAKAFEELGGPDFKNAREAQLAECYIFRHIEASVELNLSELL